MAAAWDGCGGTTISGSSRARISACAPLLRRLATEQGKDPVELFRAAVGRFKSDPGVIAKRLTLPVFLSQLEAWCAEAPEPEDERRDRVRRLRQELGEIPMRIDLAKSDAERAHWERRRDELDAALEQMGAGA